MDVDASAGREVETVLILTPSGRDAALTGELLAREQLGSHVCADVEDLCRCIEDGAAAAVLSEEVLTASGTRRLAELLSRQPPWSDFPILLFASADRPRGRAADERLRALGNVTFLDLPVQVRSMLAAVRSAIRARRRQYEARRAIESRDQFLAMLGHELRNPLSAIRLAIELTDRTQDEQRRAKHRGIIDRQTRHLARLVDDLLDVARVAHGKVALQRAPVDLEEVLRGSFQTLDAMAKAHQLSYTFTPAPTPMIVLGDRVRLEQIFGNLLTNAIKYTPRGGSVRVEVRRDGPSALVRVIDSGVGIAPELQDRVFDVFTQADRSLERSQGGMGLGLTLVRSLARLHHGEAEVHSEGVGHGAEFRVRIPLLLDRTCATAEDEPPAPGPAAARRIVLVEDNDDIRCSLESLLRTAGHTVFTARDGPEGHARILAAKPDVAFVDLGLPGFDGYEVARRVRASGQGNLLLVAVSGYGRGDDRKRAVEAGFDAHLTKPIGLEELEATMATASRAS